MIRFKNKFQRGFTLVEALVAVSIFSISVVVLMVILGKGISDTGYAKRKMTAEYLAQEGIEYIRNIRDTYVLYSATASDGWIAFNNKLLGASCDTPAHPNGCYFGDLSDFSNSSQTTALAMTPCGATCPALLYDSTNGKYNYTTGASSGFIRKITTSHLNADETKIYSTVYWTQGSGSYNITFSENLSNWVE